MDSIKLLQDRALKHAYTAKAVMEGIDPETVTPQVGDALDSTKDMVRSFRKGVSGVIRHGFREGKETLRTLTRGLGRAYKHKMQELGDEIRNPMKKLTSTERTPNLMKMAAKGLKAKEHERLPIVAKASPEAKAAASKVAAGAKKGMSTLAKAALATTGAGAAGGAGYLGYKKYKKK